MNYTLPKSVEVGGAEYRIRWDFRAILDICAALSDAELTNGDRCEAVLTIFYPDVDTIPEEHYQEAIEKCFWFIRCGAVERETNQPQLISWEQDFDLICAPVSRIVGKDVRGLEEFHWWSWVSAYMEIGDCFFSQVVGIRAKKARGQALDKPDRDFYRKTRDITDIKKADTEAERDILKEWM